MKAEQITPTPSLHGFLAVAVPDSYFNGLIDLYGYGPHSWLYRHSLEGIVFDPYYCCIDNYD